MADSAFEQHEGCAAEATGAGGVTESGLTKEACAQKCVNSICCTGFNYRESGMVCYLSFALVDGAGKSVDDLLDCTTKADTGSASDGLRWSYYQLKVVAKLLLSSGGGDRSAIINADDVATEFVNTMQMQTQLQMFSAVPKVTVARPAVPATGEGGDWQAEVTFGSGDDRDLFDRWVAADSCRFAVGGETITCLAISNGRCEIGSISMSGRENGGDGGTNGESRKCTRCRPGTYSNVARTICELCPHGTSSHAGATNVLQCYAKDADGSLLAGGGGDSTRPALTRFDVNLKHNVIWFWFNKRVASNSFDPSKITLQAASNANGAASAISLSRSFNWKPEGSVGNEIVLKIGDADAASIKNNPTLCSDRETCFVSMAAGVVADGDQNLAGPLSNSTAMQAVKFVSPEGKVADGPASRPQRMMFNYQDEYVGTFETTGVDGGSSSGGVFELKVVEVQDLIVTFLATVLHGGYCDESAGCRDQGVSRFYYRGFVRDGTSSVDMQVVTDGMGSNDDGWTGITDRTFTRESLKGEVKLRHPSKDKDSRYAAGTVTFQGGYGKKGSFHTVRRCTAADDDVVGPPQPGDRWEGHLLCDRPTADGAKAQEGEWHSRSASFQVDTVSEAGDVLGVITSDDTAVSIAYDGTIEHSVVRGSLAYKVSGKFPIGAECRAFALTPDTGRFAWQSPPLSSSVSLQWSGIVSDDFRHFKGQLNQNPHCRCLETTPEGDPFSCGKVAVAGRDMCWTSKDCADAKESKEHSGWFYTPVNTGPKCTSFTLSRVCAAVTPQLCGHSWSFHNDRCYKMYGHDGSSQGSTSPKGGRNRKSDDDYEYGYSYQYDYSYDYDYDYDYDDGYYGYQYDDNDHADDDADTGSSKDAEKDPRAPIAMATLSAAAVAGDSVLRFRDDVGGFTVDAHVVIGHRAHSDDPADATDSSSSGSMAAESNWIESIAAPKERRSSDADGNYYEMHLKTPLSHNFAGGTVVVQPPFHEARHKATTRERAAFVCEAASGRLASAGNADENSFLAGMIATSRTLAANASLWLGMGIGAAEFSVNPAKTSFWDDGTPIVYTNWDAGLIDFLRYRTISEESGVVLQANGEWGVEPEDKVLPFACERPALHVELDCNCTGVTDAAGDGGICNMWGASSSTGTANEKLSWCYTSPHCPRASPVLGSASSKKKLWRVYCADDANNPLVCSGGDEYYSERTLTCMPVSSCGSGEYVSAAPSGNADLQCAPCPAHTFQPLSRHRSPSCAEQVKCGAGEKYVEVPGGAEEAECAPCALQTYQPDDGDHRNPDCLALTPCSAGTHYAPVRPSDAPVQCKPCDWSTEWRGEDSHFFDTCLPWQECLPDVQIEVTAPTSTSDRVCSSTDPCLPGLQFEVVPATATTDRECSALEICLPGSQMAAEPTLTTDRQCAACLANTWQNAANALACKTVGYCSAGERVLVAATASSDLLCGPCPAGTWQALDAHREATCRPQSLCGKGQLFVSSSTADSGAGGGGFGPTPPFTPAPAPAQPCRTMIDAREEADYNADHADCTINIPAPEFNAGKSGLSKVRALLNNNTAAAVGVHCYRGVRSGQVKAYLEANGFTNVENDGGWASGDKAAIIAKCADADACSASNSGGGGGNTGDTAGNVQGAAAGTCIDCPEGEFQYEELHRQEWCEKQPMCGGGEQYVARGGEQGPQLLAVCKPCSDGDYRDRGPPHREKCARQPSCGKGKYAVPPVPLDELRLCRRCPQGTWEPRSNTLVTSCLPWTQCAPEVAYELVAPTAESDRVCRMQTECGRLQYEVAAPTPTSARECSTIKHTTCYPGTFVAAVSEHVGSCRPCATGTYQNLENQPECKVWSTCGVGQELVIDGTVASDSFCADCADGFFQPLDDHMETECVRKRRCGKGERVTEPSGRDAAMDAECAACFAGKYQDEAEHLDPDCKLQPVCPPPSLPSDMPLDAQFMCPPVSPPVSTIPDSPAASSATDADEGTGTGAGSSNNSKLAAILVPVLLVTVAGLVVALGWLKLKNKAAKIEIRQLREGEAGTRQASISNFHNPMWGANINGSSDGGDDVSGSRSRSSMDDAGHYSGVGGAVAYHGDLDNGYDAFPTSAASEARGEEPIYEDLPGSVMEDSASASKAGFRDGGNHTGEYKDGNEPVYGIRPLPADFADRNGVWPDDEAHLRPARPSSARSTRSTTSTYSILDAPPRRGSTDKRVLVLDSDDDPVAHERPPAYTVGITFPNAPLHAAVADSRGGGGGGGRGAGVTRPLQYARSLPQLPNHGSAARDGIMPPTPATSIGGGGVSSSGSGSLGDLGNLGGRGAGSAGGIIPPAAFGAPRTMGGSSLGSSGVGGILPPAADSVGGVRSSGSFAPPSGGLPPPPPFLQYGTGALTPLQAPRTRTSTTPSVGVSEGREVSSGIQRANGRIAQHLADAEDLLADAGGSYDRAAEAPKPRFRGGAAGNFDSEA